MAKLIGSEATEATELVREKEKPAACRFECTTGGTLEEIKLKMKAGNAVVHTVDLGIYTDSAGKTGTLLAHATAATDGTVTEQIITATGFSQKLTKGTFYHLAFVDKTGGAKTKYKKEVGKEDITTESVLWTELKEAGTWANLAESTLEPIWGLGKEEVAGAGYIAPITPPTFFSPRRLSMPRTWEGVPVTVEDVKQASATLTLKTADSAKVGQIEGTRSALTLKTADTAKVGQVEGTQSSLTLKTADSAKAGQVTGANTAIGMKAATTDKASQQISGKATVTVTFQAAAHAVTTSAVAAKTGVRFELTGKAATEVESVLQISSKLGIMFGASATPKSIAKATANLNVTMTIHATVKATQEEAGRRVVIMLYEE